ncbi:MAG: hypothetical protein NTW72_02145 [Gemmatimonadetes bacterium]|nr:hypothetical protein [Gemmatimonadota bacterium]
MMRPIFATATLAVFAFGAGPQQGTPGPTPVRTATVRTSVGIQQGRLAGVVGDAPLVFGPTGGGEENGEGKSERKNLGKNEGKNEGKSASKGETPSSGSDPIVTATSTPVVRSNTSWRLRVTLVAPMDPALVVKVTAKDGKAVELSGKAMSAVVAEGATRCARCEVRLGWQFVFATEPKGKKATPRVIPVIRYSAEPLV